MSDFFVYLETHRVGILIALLCLVGLVAIVQWLTWLFSKGRFSSEVYKMSRPSSMRFIVSEFGVKIINEFGHLIALIILFIFSFTLIFAMFQTRGNPAEMRDSLQTIVSSLGGLVGAVIGYYFNSAVKNLESPAQSGVPKPPPIDAHTQLDLSEGEVHRE